MAEMQSNRNDDLFGSTDKKFGTPNIDALALKYSKAQLQQMAQMGRIPPIYAVMAGMAQDRIQLNNSHAPETTVAQDTFGQHVTDSSGQGVTDSSGSAVGTGVPGNGGREMPGGSIQEIKARTHGAEMGWDPRNSAADISKAHGGLMSIPRPGEKYDQSNFATGGIVAFDAGGEVPESTGLNSLDDYYKQVEARRASVPDTQAQALQAYYAGAPERAKSRSDKDFNMNLIRLGANIGAQTGVEGFGMQNAFKGLAATVPNFAESLAGQRADEEAGIKGMADIEQKRRTEAIEGQKSAEGIFKELRQASIHAGKDTDMDTQIGTYVAYQKELAKLGVRKDNPSDSKLRNEAMDRIREDKIRAAQLSLSGVQGNTAVSQDRVKIEQLEADIKRDEASRKEAKDVSDAVDKEFKSMIAPKGTKAYTYQELLKAGKFAEANLMHEQEVQRIVELRRGATRKAISSDEIVAPVATKTPLAAKLPPLPKDIQKLIDKTYPTK